MDLHFAHQLAHHGGAFLEGSTCVSTLGALWIERHFAQAIIEQDQTTVGDSKFRQTNRLRSKVKSDQARRSGHGVKALNRNHEMPKQISSSRYKKRNELHGQVRLRRK